MTGILHQINARTTSPSIATGRQSPNEQAQLFLLGGFGLEIDGERLDLQPALRRLLALVALTPRGIDRIFAAFQLWPDAREERARASLRSALWRLRKLPVEIIDSSKSRLRLSEHVWVDARHGLANLSSNEIDDGIDPTLPFDGLLFDLLPDWYEDWLIVERERLRQLSLRTLECRARTFLDAGDLGAAIQTGLAAVAVDPLRCSAHRIVIEAHIAEGNHSEARRQFEIYEKQTEAATGSQPAGIDELISVAS